MSKYDCITHWLSAHIPETVEVTIDALEEVIGFAFLHHAVNTRG